MTLSTNILNNVVSIPLSMHFAIWFCHFALQNPVTKCFENWLKVLECVKQWSHAPNNAVRIPFKLYLRREGGRYIESMQAGGSERQSHTTGTCLPDPLCSLIRPKPDGAGRQQNCERDWFHRTYLCRGSVRFCSSAQLAPHPPIASTLPPPPPHVLLNSCQSLYGRCHF